MSSTGVNQFRWINIWTSILGYSLSELPALFLLEHFLSIGNRQNFLTAIAGYIICFCILPHAAV
ncbi:MAG TPA: hypothetical protein DGH25_08675 [Erwiniaceae bacterium]|nr:hypothetical protein [Erwiniaceae bacterium]